ncbi:conserved hypothetical protein [Ricinus communis]|uniref:Uncharacterized protein n=1 Tax=Ricinus communis TaxID=3988 RepID=B9SZL1_RICCO|nr:conserved hypothetical protein [Ricinus communis]
MKLASKSGNKLNNAHDGYVIGHAGDMFTDDMLNMVQMLKHLFGTCGMMGKPVGRLNKSYFWFLNKIKAKEIEKLSALGSLLIIHSTAGYPDA